MTDRLHRLPERCDVAIVGAGPAGLSAAIELKRLGVEDVVVLDREPQGGGIPRHCGHPPFGVHEFKRVYTGPVYARRLVERAIRHKVSLHFETTVTSIGKDGALTLSTHSGLKHIKADKVILCTGVRETPRASRLISGQRPLGILTTGALQSMVYLKGTIPFRNPIITGTELVSFSALLTCRHAGIKPVAMVENNNRVTAYSAARILPTLLGIPVYLDTRLDAIKGKQRVTGARLIDASGRAREVVCDGIVFSGKFIPEVSLIRMGHLDIDPNSNGPKIDQFGRCSDPDYFATGNLIRAVETAGWCYREGRRTAHNVALSLRGHLPDTGSQIKVICDSPLIKYVVPQTLCLTPSQSGTQHDHTLQIRFNEAVDGVVSLVLEDREIWRKKVSALPERRVLIPLPALMHTMSNKALRVCFVET